MKLPRTSGNYTLPTSYKATGGQTIRTEQHNPPLEDIAQALTDSMPRDGSAPMIGNLPMSGQRITGLGAALNDSDAVRRDQVTLYSAWLAAVAELEFAGNKLAYATGAGTAALTDFSAFARTLLDDANAPAARATLGIGAAGTRGLSSSPDFEGVGPAELADRQTIADYISTMGGNQTGAAPVYAARAWVNFNETGGIRSAGNVSSVTRNGVGDFTVNFTTALPTGNYCVTGSVMQSPSDGNVFSIGPTFTGMTTTSCNVLVRNRRGQETGSSLDSPIVSLAFFA